MDNNKWERNHHGAVTQDGIETMHFRQCVHCAMQWRSVLTMTPLEMVSSQDHQPQLRGDCFKCMGPTCGPNCPIPPGECMPWAQVNELIRVGVLRDWNDPKLQDREFYHRTFFVA